MGQVPLGLVERGNKFNDLSVELGDVGFGLVGVVGTLEGVDIGENLLRVNHSVGIDVTGNQFPGGTRFACGKQRRKQSDAQKGT